MIFGQTRASDSPSVDKFKSYKLTSFIKICYSLTVPHNVKCHCASSVSVWAAFAFFLLCFCTCHAVFWYPRLLANMTAPLTEALFFQAEVRHPLILPFSHPTWEGLQFSPSANLCYAKQSFFSPESQARILPSVLIFLPAVNVGVAPQWYDIKTKPLRFWSMYVVRGDSSATVQQIWLGETPFLAIHLSISFQYIMVLPPELFTFPGISSSSWCFLASTIFASVFWVRCQLGFWSFFYFPAFYNLCDFSNTLDCRSTLVLTNLSLYPVFSICTLLKSSACTLTLSSGYAEPATERFPLQCSTCLSHWR